MKTLMFFLACSLGLFVFSCGTTGGTNTTMATANTDPGLIIEPDQTISLVDHLRRVPGVQVNGDGVNATIKIRGINSFYGTSEPLFILNGQQLAGGLRDAMQLIPVEQINSIRVLKNPGDTGFYGVRGANGVIVITLN